MCEYMIIADPNHNAAYQSLKKISVFREPILTSVSKQNSFRKQVDGI